MRGAPEERQFALFHLAAGNVVQAVEAVNAAPADFMAGRSLVARQKQVAPAVLRDVSQPLKDVAA